MADLFEVLTRMERVLETHGVRHALVGGLAVAAWAEARFTKDVDLAVSVSDQRSAEAVIFAAQQSGFRVAIVLEHHDGTLATVRLRPVEAPDILVDLLFATSGIEAEVVAGAHIVGNLPGGTHRVAAPQHLIAMKVLSFDPIQRGRDAQDILGLLKTLAPDELDEVGRLLTLMTERGRDQGKDLHKVWQDIRSAADAPGPFRTRS